MTVTLLLQGVEKINDGQDLASAGDHETTFLKFNL